MLDSLRTAGFQIEFHSHAEAILSVDFAAVADQLETILATATIPIAPGLNTRIKKADICISLDRIKTTYEYKFIAGDASTKLHLRFDGSRINRYASRSQQARVLSEGWVQSNVYCVNCGNKRIQQYKNNNPATDFHCLSCDEEYELKGKRGRFGGKIVNGAYHTLVQKLRTEQNPNLILLAYDTELCSVLNLEIIPKHFFTPEIVEARRPLSASARRAGWIGCDINLTSIPLAGRICIVENQVARSKFDVLENWNKTRFLREKNVRERTWLLTVMSLIDSLGRKDFALNELYVFEERLRYAFPKNKHVKEKIRQQLQTLRDGGYIEFTARGCYSVVKT